MGFFSKDKKPSQSLSQLQGVPEGSFRCSVCSHIMPYRCLHGAVADKSLGVVHLCVICARWLNVGYFPQGMMFNFRDETIQSIKLLQADIELAKQNKYSIKDYMPRYRDWLAYRDAMLQQGLIDVIDKLTRCVFVEPSLINRINKGK